MLEKMTDECDIDELTAFLEADDEYDDDENKTTNKPFTKQASVDKADTDSAITMKKPLADFNDGEDKLTEEDIAAFLLASDDDDSDDDDKCDKKIKENTDMDCDEMKQLISCASGDRDQGQLNDNSLDWNDHTVDEECTEGDDGLSKKDNRQKNTGHLSLLNKDHTRSTRVVDTDNSQPSHGASSCTSSNPVLDAKAIEAEMKAMMTRMKELQDILLKSQCNSSSNCSQQNSVIPNSSSKSCTAVSQHSSPKSSKATQACHQSPNVKIANTSPKMSQSPKLHTLNHNLSETNIEVNACNLLSSDNVNSAKLNSNSVNSTKLNSDNVNNTNSSSKKGHCVFQRCVGNDKGNKAVNCERMSEQQKMKSRDRKSKSEKQKVKCDKMSEEHYSLVSELQKIPEISSAAAEDNPFFAASSKSLSQPQSTPSSTSNVLIVDSKSIFGDLDDSDWEDLAGDEKPKLSEEGIALQKLIMSGKRKREAHEPSYDSSVLQKPVKLSDPTSSVKGSPKTQSFKPGRLAVDPATGTVSGKFKVRDEYRPKTAVALKEEERETVTDPYCSIRIINPRISMEEFKRKMDGRRLIKICRLLSNSGAADLQKDNWVTMGVVVHKSDPRQAASGNTYCIWRLCDLQNCDKIITFFLFGNVYKEHWKNDIGIVIALLNPSVMDKAEKVQSDFAVTINHPQQLLLMGISKDLGRCRATTKSGQPCASFINKQQGEYCTYHIQKAYRKASSKRQELQACTGFTPKAFNNKKSKQNGCFFYGGNTYTTLRSQGNSTKDSMTLKKLQTMHATKAAGKITTMSLHELEPEHELKLQQLEEKDKNLLELLSVPTVGSMNFVKHLVKKDAVDSLKSKDSSEAAVIPSMSAKDLLKQHQQTLQQMKLQSAKLDLLATMPKLCKGLSQGEDILLDAPIRNLTGAASTELAKRLAIDKIKKRGGIEKVDSNAVRKKIASPEVKEKIKKIVAENIDIVSNECASNDVRIEASEPPNKKSKLNHNSSSQECSKKKSKLLGDLDLNSPEVKKLLKMKSKHKGALAEVEAEHTEIYFSALEKKEKMEEKMDSIKEVPVQLYHCVQCKYSYYSVHDRCKKENHTIKKTKGVKRFFKCKQCKKRSESFDKIHTQPCKDCGNTTFDRVSMLKERKGPQLESEQLSIRGNEQKYLGSLQSKSYLNVT